MVYLITLVLWLNTGSTLAVSKTFPSADACAAARTNAIQGLETHADDMAKSGVASYVVTPCTPFSNPATETKS